MSRVLEYWIYKAKRGEYGIVKTLDGFYVVKKPTVSDLKYDYIKNRFSEDMKAWKKDSQYTVVKNQKVLDSIKVP